jgi:tetratricopeptide (TPR) repeat protein
VSQTKFAQQLRRLRKARGLTQRDLAGASLSVSYVSLLEAGKRSPTPETIRILADALSCDVHELIESDDTEQPLALVLAQADLALQAGQFSGALERYEQVIGADPDDPVLLRRARLGQAQSLHRTGRLTDAAKIYERCVRLGEEDPANEFSLQIQISWCRCLVELGELVRAADVGKAALAEFDALDAQESEMSIRLVATVAAIWYELGDLREAERLLDEGLQRATAVRSPTARGAIVWNASLVAHERGRYTESLELSEEALQIFRGSNSGLNIGGLLLTRGYLLLRCDPPRVDEAFASLTEALAELGDSPDPVMAAGVDTELCYVHLARGQWAEAISAAENARRRLGTTAQLYTANATTALAIALTADGQHDTARALFTEAATVLDHLGATRQAARSWIELAHALTDTGDLHEAITAYEHAARAMNIDDPRWRHPRTALA